MPIHTWRISRKTAIAILNELGHQTRWYGFDSQTHTAGDPVRRDAWAKQIPCEGSLPIACPAYSLLCTENSVFISYTQSLTYKRLDAMPMKIHAQHRLVKTGWRDILLHSMTVATMTGRPICEGHICNTSQATSCPCVKSRPLGVDTAQEIISA